MGTCVGAAATPVVVDVASRAIVGICPAAEGGKTEGGGTSPSATEPLSSETFAALSVIIGTHF